MAQATRCPHCDTAFKVVRDQLLLREGWVRCGHCGEPFNALDHLIELPAPRPAAAAAPAPPPLSEAIATTATPAEPAAAPAEPAPVATPLAAGLRWSNIPLDQPTYAGFLPLTVQAYDLAPASPTPAETATPSAASADTTAPQQPQDLAPESLPHPEPIAPDLPAEPPDADAQPQAAADLLAETEAAPLSEFSLNEALNYHFNGEEAPQAAADTLAVAKAAAAEPEFVRQARRQAFWSSGAARAVLALLSLLLVLLLAAQAALHWRDTLAQQWPDSRPWLQQLCQATTGCSVGAPRNLDALVIDASALSPAADGLELTILLRNRVDRAVAWPAVELTLTDAQGRIQQRKVLDAAQYLPAAQATGNALRAGIAPGQQQQLQLHLAVRGTPPAGYKLVLFYP